MSKVVWLTDEQEHLAEERIWKAYEAFTATVPKTERRCGNCANWQDGRCGISMLMSTKNGVLVGPPTEADHKGCDDWDRIGYRRFFNTTMQQRAAYLTPEELRTTWWQRLGWWWGGHCRLADVF